MLNRKKVFIMLTIILAFFAGCSSEKGPYVQIRFGEFWDSEFNVSNRIKSLDDERVSITGFIAMQSPLDGSFIYLTNAPLVTCPYCIPGTNTPVSAIPAIARPWRPIKYTEQPVTITGILEVKEKTDDFGYTTPFRIKIESIAMTDMSVMPQSLKDYNMLSSEGLIDEVTAVIIQAYIITIDRDQSETFTDDAVIIEKIDIERINALESSIKGYSLSSFDPLINILEDLKEASLILNAHIDNDETEKLTDYNEDVYFLWERYFDWSNIMAAIE